MGNFPVTTILKKFVRELNPKIASLVYSTNPTNLAAAIDTAIRIATDYELNSRNSKIYQIKREDEIVELREQIANLAMIEQIKVEKEKEAKLRWNGQINWSTPIP